MKNLDAVSISTLTLRYVTGILVVYNLQTSLSATQRYVLQLQYYVLYM